MATDFPYHTLFETFGRVPSAHAEAVNAEPRERLVRLLQVPVEAPGRWILLRAPRAGHGKTHLLSSVSRTLGGGYEFVSLQENASGGITARSVLSDVLRGLTRPLPAGGGLCVLDLVARHLFALALQPLVASGEVPCQDREGALLALRNRPIETFDFHHPNAVTAHWARENFDILGQRLAIELSRRSVQGLGDVMFWVETLFHFAATPIDQLGRVQKVVGEAQLESYLAMERLVALLGLLTQLMRVVLVADDVEGLSADEAAALKFASLLTSLRQQVDRLDVVLSLNQDIWHSAFVPRLSDGMLDRLSETVIDLQPLTQNETLALLESRAPGEGARVLRFLETDGPYARGVLKAATAAWLKAEDAEASKPVDPSPPADEPEVVPDAVTSPDAVRTESPQAASLSSAPAAPEEVSSKTAMPIAAERAEAADPTESASEDKRPEPAAAAEPRESSKESEDPSEPAVVSPDRVDELLRQFRERYGR